MDVTFPCPHCKQELEADAAMAGSTIQCPSCGSSLSIPAPDLTNVKVLNPISSSAAAKEEKHFVVPVHEGPTEVLISRAPVKDEDQPAVGPKQVRIKSIRRIDCVEVGHDRFDEVVTLFLNKVGHENIISINTISYTHIDIGSQKLLTDYGVMMVYRH